MKTALLLAIFMGVTNASYASNTYMLKTGEAAASRLNKQHEVMKENSIEQLQRAGLSRGQTVFDIGCGSGAMTTYLAQQVGEAGLVYAIDISPEQLEVTRKAVESAGFSNVIYIEGDILNASTLPNVKADIIYLRYVLMHLLEPKKAVAVMKSCLKAGGAVVGQESILSEASTEPKVPVVERIKSMRSEIGKRLGVDSDIGKNLQEIYEDAGYAPVEVYRAPHRVPVLPFSEVSVKSFHELKAKYINAGLMTEDESVSIEQLLENLPQTHPDLLYIFEQGHVIAKMPVQ